jgi:hypothetical protein
MKLYKTHQIEWNFSNQGINFTHDRIQLDHMGVNPAPTSYIPEVTIDVDNSGRRDDSLVEKIIKTLEADELQDFSGIKTIYRYPKLNLSRDKVSLYCEEKGLKVIRDSSKADVRIISMGLIKTLVSETWYNSFIKRSDFIDAMRAFPSAFENLEEHIKIITDTIDEDAYISSRRQYYGIPDSFDKRVRPFFVHIDEKVNKANCSVIIEPQNLKNFNEIFTGQFKWIMDEKANKLMSSDSVTLDDAMYIQLKDMIKSGNPEDITVAMTTLANCNIETSKTYIAILFFHFFEYFKSCKTFNTINFKSLRKAFQKYYDKTSYNHGHSGRYESLIKMLVEDDALTVNAMEHVLDLVFEEVILRSTGLKNCKDVFAIERSSITLTPEFSAKANSMGLKTALMFEADDLPF